MTANTVGMLCTCSACEMRGLASTSILASTQRAAAASAQPLEDRRELLARLAPVGPQVEQHRHLERAVEHLGLEVGLGDVDDVLAGRRAAGASAARAAASLRALTRGEVDGAGHGGDRRRARGWAPERARVFRDACRQLSRRATADRAPVTVRPVADASRDRARRADGPGLDRGASTGRRPATPSTAPPPPPWPRRSAPSTPTTPRPSRCCAARAARSAPVRTSRRCPTRSTPTCPRDGPMGPSRLRAEQAGHRRDRAATRWPAAWSSPLWCDLRVMEADAVLGVFCRRWGVPLIDGGTVRLPAHRRPGPGARPDPHRPPVGADEALAIGLRQPGGAAGHGAGRGRGAGRRARRPAAGLPALGPRVGLRRARTATSAPRCGRSSARPDALRTEGAGRPASPPAPAATALPPPATRTPLWEVPPPKALRQRGGATVRSGRARGTRPTSA